MRAWTQEWDGMTEFRVRFGNRVDRACDTLAPGTHRVDIQDSK